MQYVVYDRMTWAQIFSLMERAKRSLNLQDYSVYQTSLEQVRCLCVCVSMHAEHVQVFLEFARHQFEEQP